MSHLDFKDRVAIITGAGGGLGRTYAEELAARGAKVVVNDLGGNISGDDGSRSMADEVVDAIKAKGGHAVANYDSVATPSGGQAIVDCAIENFGKLDIVINNAGNLRNAPIDEITEDMVEALLSVHLKGTFNVTIPAFKVMKTAGYGRILFTSSAAGLFGNLQQAAYGAAKTGLVGLMNACALEGAKYNIRCNALLPTAHTRMATVMDDEMMEKMGQLFESLGSHLGATTSPEFITPLATYLVSEHCSSNQGLFSASLGRYARLSIGVGQGWVGPRDTPPTAEDISMHFDQISDTNNAIEVKSLLDEFQIIQKQLLHSE